ncbi:MAG: cyclic nucleotide-binding domain-containing protein [Methyloprofundus sp.]|nr:cyclic nucleotide-binding domain-containing protein [Methyloprofundus sp.]
MAVDPNSEDGIALRKLFPLETMPARQYDALCANMLLEERPKGSLLFKQGDVPNSFLYLIDGELSLESDEFQTESIIAGTDSAKFALAHQFPRQISARAVKNIVYIGVPLNAFEQQEQEEEEVAYMVEDEGNDDNEGTGDWMSALLKSPIFQRLPPMNLQKVLMRLEDVEVKKGEVVFQQGDEGEYYYLIKKGRCALSRKASARAKEIKLLELRRNETFGEDSLLSDEPRSMTVTAMTDMLLSRIDKECFNKVIKEPVLDYVNYKEALAEYENSEAIMVDIRGPEEYGINHVEGSQNIPFFSMRMSLKDLATESKKIILICADGKISMAAAFVLIKNGIDAEILDQGMLGVPQVGIEAPEKADDPSIASEDDSDASDSLIFTGDEQDLSGLEAEIAGMDLGFDFAQENEDLKADNKRLTEELELVKKKYKLLYTQTGKLKMAFDRLQAQLKSKA